MTSESLPTKSVAIYGAAGHTGHFVVAELTRRGLVPVAVGRDEAKLAVAGLAPMWRREWPGSMIRSCLIAHLLALQR